MIGEVLKAKGLEDLKIVGATPDGRYLAQPVDFGEVRVLGPDDFEAYGRHYEPPGKLSETDGWVRIGRAHSEAGNS